MSNFYKDWIPYVVGLVTGAEARGEPCPLKGTGLKEDLTFEVTPGYPTPSGKEFVPSNWVALSKSGADPNSGKGSM